MRLIGIGAMLGSWVAAVITVLVTGELPGRFTIAWVAFWTGAFVGLQWALHAVRSTMKQAERDATRGRFSQ